MPFVKNQYVRCLSGVKDRDTDTDLSGWSGYIQEISEGLLTINWDADTIVNIPLSYKRDSLDKGYEFSSYYIEPEAVELVTANLALGEQKALSAREQLLEGIESIQGNGVFCVSGNVDFVSPGLEVAGLGELAFPLAEEQAKAIQELATAAPYGKGAKTITDPKVRRAWEIDASLLKFNNPAWERFLASVLKEVRKQMEIEDTKVSAKLYKLLLYQEGDFFLPHKDSEKEAGMFATLSLGLPSVHTGGELLVRFEGEEEKVDFSLAASQYRIPYAAFYADCEHEIKPLRSGYRLGLIYNLTQSAKAKRKLGLQTLGAIEEALVDSLVKMIPDFEEDPLTVLLGHQYTPANFSLSRLKGHDRARAKALISAAEQAGYYAKAGLLTYYKMGELEDDGYYYNNYRRRRSSWYEDEEEEQQQGENTMGEVYEESIKASHWASDAMPSLVSLEIDRKDILTLSPIGEDEPIEEEAEGFTGNAGMTLEYWYHYGAIFLWPKNIHTSLLANIPIGAKLEWLNFYEKNWAKQENRPEAHSKQILKDLLLAEQPGRFSWDQSYNYKPIAKILLRITDKKFRKSTAVPLLSKYFIHIKADAWPKLYQQYGATAVETVLEEGRSAFMLDQVLAYLAALDGLHKKAEADDMVVQQLRTLPAYLLPLGLENPKTQDKKTAQKILLYLIKLSPLVEKETAWLEQINSVFCDKFSRFCRNEVIIAVLREKDCPHNTLWKQLLARCREDIANTTSQPPQPPLDWAREMPAITAHWDVWKMLRDFILSPTMAYFDYKAVQSERNLVMNAISNTQVDLRTETIRKGSPHTLRLIKTQTFFDKALKAWRHDVNLAESLDQLLQ